LDNTNPNTYAITVSQTNMISVKLAKIRLKKQDNTVIVLATKMRILKGSFDFDDDEDMAIPLLDSSVRRYE
jgi:hypothetical protein